MLCINFNKNISVKHPYEAPFVAVRSLICDWEERFIEEGQKVVLLRQGVDLDKDSFLTSCVNTVAAVANLFFGSEKASLMMEVIRESIAIRMAAREMNHWRHYSIINLFEGIILHEYLEKGGDLKLFTTANKVKIILDAMFFWNVYLQDEAHEGTPLKYSLLAPRFNFNFDVIDKLKRKIVSNESTITRNRSMGYLVAIIEYVASKYTHIFDHCFIIEQFLTKRGVRYRIYQSWIGDFSLKRAYEMGLLNHKTRDEILHFCDKMENLYSCTPQTTYDAVFGGEKGKMGPAKPCFENNILRGPGLRFIAEPIDTLNVQKTFQHLSAKKLKIKKSS